MKNRILLFLAALIFLFTVTSCKSLNEENNHNIELEKSEALNIMPFNERKFIYQNGLNIEYEQNTVNEDNIIIDRYYPKINGLINKKVEEKINEDIVNLVNTRIKEVENSITSKSYDSEIKSISTSAYIDYNCNNVMFIEFSSYITYDLESVSESYYFIKSLGYDLNTGNKLSLKDLFKEGIDYNKIINDYVYMEIIKSNYDDPDSLYMNKPFQGIKNDQSFLFDENRLLVVVDEKNEEFNHTGYPVTIHVPLKVIGDELAIFDRYFDEEKNIFEKERVKRLMPNFTYYKVTGGIREREEYYNIYIETGEFANIDDFETNKLLDSLVSSSYLDVEGFKERANAFKASHPGIYDVYYGSMYHHVDVMMSAGGYLSLTAYSGKDELDITESYQKYINFDLNNKKIMTLKDLFVDGFDYKTKILEILKTNPNYYLPKGTFAEGEEILIAESDFNFNQEAFFIILYQPGVDVREYYMWIQYEDIGYKNISIFQ